VRARIALGAFALVLGSAVFVVPAHAQTDTTAPALALTSQDAWTPAAGTFTMGLQTSGNTDGLRLTLTVHDRLLSRSAFDATLGDSPTFPQTLTLKRLSLDDYPADASGVRVVQVELNTLGIRRSGNGVYPIEVQLRDANDTTLAGFVTHIVVVDLSAVAPKQLDVAWVWPLVAAPALALDGTPDPAVVSQLVPTGRLGRQAAAIAADADVPLTLAPSPETLDAWLSLAQSPDNLDLAVGVAALQGAVPRHQVLASSFVPLDLPSLFDAGLGATLGNELDQGGDKLQTFFNAHLDPSTAMPGTLDTPSLDALRNSARSRLVVDGSALEPYAGRFTATRPALLGRAPGSSSDAVTVVATDTGIESFLQGDEPPALRAAHLLGALAVIQAEQPSLPRAVAFANPSNWDPSDQFVTAVLAGLRANPFVRPVTVDTLLAETPPSTIDDAPDGDPVVRTLAPATVRKAPVKAGNYYQGLLDRNAIAALFGNSDAHVAHADRTLLSVLSANLENPAGRRLARDQLHAIGQSGRDFLSLIHAPEQSTITLTSSEAKIPLTFRNDADQRVPIHIALASDKLVFPDGTDRHVTLEPGKNQTVRIAVETRSSGTFPLTMTVTTEGGLPIQTSEVTVRSSFVSGVGVFLTVGAILFLALWWGWDIRRRRRRRQTA
jgi:Family of unknown function (DUF6049)